jgi:hypothetical protein
MIPRQPVRFPHNGLTQVGDFRFFFGLAQRSLLFRRERRGRSTSAESRRAMIASLGSLGLAPWTKLATAGSRQTEVEDHCMQAPEWDVCFASIMRPAAQMRIKKKSPPVNCFSPGRKIKEPITGQRFQAMRQITPGSATVLDDLLASHTSKLIRYVR